MLLQVKDKCRTVSSSKLHSKNKCLQTQIIRTKSTKKNKIIALWNEVSFTIIDYFINILLLSTSPVGWDEFWKRTNLPLPYSHIQSFCSSNAFIRLFSIPHIVYALHALICAGKTTVARMECKSATIRSSMIPSSSTTTQCTSHHLSYGTSSEPRMMMVRCRIIGTASGIIIVIFFFIG